MKKKLFKAAVVLVFGAIIAAILYLILRGFVPDFINILRNGDRNDMELFIRAQSDISGAVLVALLQFVQIFSIVFPAAPIQIAPGIVFGSWLAWVLCFFASLLAQCIVFAAARKLGGKLDKWFGIDDTEKKPRFNLIARSDHPGFMVFIACLIPLLPNGIIPYLAARTKVRFSHFALAFASGSAIPIFVFCAIGSTLLDGNYTLTIILAAVAVITVITLYVKQNEVMTLAFRFRDFISEKHSRKRSGKS